MLVHTTQLLSFRHVPLWRPPTDVYETDTALVAQVEVAGMQNGDFNITLEDRLLTIHGVRADSPGERRAYFQMEIPSGEFRIEVDLPIAVDPDAIDAVYEDGFLRVTMLKPVPGKMDIRESE